jgi:hypothetical protein
VKPARNSEHIFHVQVGFKAKGAYLTRYSSDSVGRAELYYRCINIGRGYKKRLITRTGRVIHRDTSSS